jgi:hypothetical protein
MTILLVKCPNCGKEVIAYFTITFHTKEKGSINLLPFFQRKITTLSSSNPHVWNLMGKPKKRNSDQPIIGAYSLASLKR